MSKRDDCYAHLRLRGSQMRMAREARKQRLRPLFLPSLDDLPSVRATHFAGKVSDFSGKIRLRRATTGVRMAGWFAPTE
jgi:hypothetical protein